MSGTCRTTALTVAGLALLLATGGPGWGCGKYGRPTRPDVQEMRAEAPAEAPIEVEPGPPVGRESEEFETEQ